MWKLLSDRRPRRYHRGTLMTQLPGTTDLSVQLPDSGVELSLGIEEPEVVNTLGLAADDIVIAVRGPPRSGKSTFICAASGHSAMAVGGTSRTLPDQVSAVKFWDDASKRYVVLLDTPACDDPLKSDLDIRGIVSEWLVSNYKRKLLSGVLYLHRITDDGSSLESLQAFQKSCGKDALNNVFLTTTMWDEVEWNAGERRLEELKTQHWRKMIAQGAQVARCRCDDDSPKRLIRQIIISECGAIPPLQPPHVETRQGPSHSQAEPQRSEGGPQVPQSPAEDRQKPYSQIQGVEKQTHTGREPTHTVRRGSVQVTEELATANTKCQEGDDALAGTTGLTPSPLNIVMFGEAGVGKSSVVNLLANAEVANTSHDAWGCTLESKQYTFEVEKKTFIIWDTIGLGEPGVGVTNYLAAIERAYMLIRQIKAQGGLDLLLFCIPGSRVTMAMLSNYRLFFEVLCEKQVPIAVVVTRLEDEERMEDWWVRNEKYVTQCGLTFGGHACITGRRGDPKAAEGRAALESLLLSCDKKRRYSVPPTSGWFSGLLKRLPSILRPKGKQKGMEDLLRDRCMMDSTHARRLAETLTRLREHDC